MKYLGVMITEDQMELLDGLKKLDRGMDKSKYIRRLLSENLIDDVMDMRESKKRNEAALKEVKKK